MAFVATDCSGAFADWVECGSGSLSAGLIGGEFSFGIGVAAVVLVEVVWEFVAVSCGGIFAG